MKPIQELTNEELSEAIGDGIYKGFWSPILIGLIIFLLAFLAFLLSTYFFSSTNGVQEGQLPEIERNCFPLENLRCHVVISNETTETNTGYFTICGYQEANAKFEQIKPEIEEWLDKENSSLKIKQLECM